MARVTIAKGLNTALHQGRGHRFQNLEIVMKEKNCEKLHFLAGRHRLTCDNNVRADKARRGLECI